MNATFAQVNSALYDILDLLDGSGKPLQVVYSYPEVNPSGYPCAYPILKGAREFINDTQNNRIVMDFIIRIILRDSNDQTAYSLMLSVLQDVTAEMRKDDHFTLGGIVERFEVSPQIDIYRSNDSDMSLVICDVNVSALTVVDTTL